MAPPEASQSRPLVVALLFVALVGVLATAVWLLLSARPGEDENGHLTGGPNPLVFSLEAEKVAVRAVGETSPEAVDAAVEQVTETIEQMMLSAFVDPARWEDATFPDAFSAFDDPAAARARKELAAVTLGPAARRLSWVEPGETSFRVQVLLDRSSRAVLAFAGLDFEATGHLDGGGSTPVTTSGHYFLRPHEGAWKIFSYRARTTVGERTQATPEAAGAAAGTSP